MKKLLLKSIRFYQKYLSFDTGILKYVSGGPVCRYSPTCSQYTYEQVDKYGILRGVWLGFKRFLTCNPWHHD